MGCNHSSPSRSDDLPQVTRLPQKHTPATQPSTESQATGSASQHTRASSKGSVPLQIIAKADPHSPPKTNTSVVERRALPSASLTSSGSFVTPGGNRAPLTEERKQLLKSIRAGPSIRDRDPSESDQFLDAFEKLSPETIRKTLFNKENLRGVTITPHSDTPFVYEPLPTSTSIRLLHLLPEREDGLIRCTLTTVDLKRPPVPEFSCLSYTWGNPFPRGVGFPQYDDAEKAGEFSPQNRRPISCNGRLLHIRQNLYDAFKQLPVHPYNYVAGEGLETSLHHLAAEGRRTLLYYHLLKGAPINALDMNGKSPLHHGAANGHFDTVDILLKSGSDLHQVDYSNKTAVDYAWENGYTRISELITSFTPDKRVPLPTNHQRRTIAKQNYLWVDAICINQNDLKEKTHQVNMIDWVYKSAITTVIWLGREDVLTKMSVETILKLYPLRDVIRESDIATYQPMSPEEYEARGLPNISQKEWDALASIYLRQWFHRVWVLQEVVLAQNVVCFCGPHQIPWHLVQVTKVLDEFEQWNRAGSFRYTPPDGTPWQIERNFAHMLSCRERRLLDEATPEQRTASRFYRGPDKRCQKSLARLVLDSWTLSSTDPRDKVFGLLALTRGDPESPPILADYNMPVEQVYAHLLKKMILQPVGDSYMGMSDSVGPLYVLSLVVNNDARMNTLPSWVPDFRVPGTNPLEAGSFSFRAAGLSSSTVEWGVSTASWNELSLRGSRVGTITGATRERQATGAATKFALDSTWFELLRTVRTPYPTGQLLSEVLWRTLCADQDAAGNSPAPMRLGSQFRDFVCAQIFADSEWVDPDGLPRLDGLLDVLGLLPEINTAGPGETFLYDTKLGIEVGLGAGKISVDRPYPRWLQRLVESEPQSFIPSFPDVCDFAKNPKYRIWDPRRRVWTFPPRGQNDYAQAFARAFGGRRMFKMAGVDGGPDFLGLSNMSLQLGDEVWILPGSNVPFVLRKVNLWYYQLVGDAYVHGMMHGEGFQDELTHVILV